MAKVRFVISRLRVQIPSPAPILQTLYFALCTSCARIHFQATQKPQKAGVPFPLSLPFSPHSPRALSTPPWSLYLRFLQRLLPPSSIKDDMKLLPCSQNITGEVCKHRRVMFMRLPYHVLGSLALAVPTGTNASVCPAVPRSS
jgi:hypothetical protein